MREVDGAVDRIDEPAQPSRLAARATFFGEDRSAGREVFEHAADRGLRAQVPFGDEIARVLLAPDLLGARTGKHARCGANRLPRDLEQLVWLGRGHVYRSSRIATRAAPSEALNVSVADTALPSVERSTTRNPNLAAKKSLALSVNR